MKLIRFALHVLPLKSSLTCARNKKNIIRNERTLWNTGSIVWLPSIRHKIGSVIAVEKFIWLSNYLSDGPHSSYKNNGIFGWKTACLRFATLVYPFSLNFSIRWIERFIFTLGFCVVVDVFTETNGMLNVKCTRSADYSRMSLIL